MSRPPKCVAVRRQNGTRMYFQRSRLDRRRTLTKHMNSNGKPLFFILRDRRRFRILIPQKYL